VFRVSGERLRNVIDAGASHRNLVVDIASLACDSSNAYVVSSYIVRHSHSAGVVCLLEAALKITLVMRIVQSSNLTGARR
jgi:hypothetical protein